VADFLEGKRVRREEDKKEQRTEVMDQRSGKTRSQWSEVGGRKDRDQKSEVRSQKSEERGKIKEEPDIKLFYEKELLGSAGTLLANREWVADGWPFFILYGDNLTNVDLRRMYEFHLGHGLPFTLGVFKAERPESCGIAEVDEDGVVVGFEEKPERPKSDLAAAGVYMADQRIFECFPEGADGMRPLDLGFDVIPRLAGKMKAYFIEEFLMDIGTVESYRKAQDIYPQITQITRIK
jgi:NDP-sugar pyrophosphorylase family protein